MGLRTGGRRAKSLKNRVESSKIELQFREVRLEGSSPRAAVLQEIIDTSKCTTPPEAACFRGFLCLKICPDCSVLMELSKKNQPDPDADYHDEDEDALELPEDDGDEDEEVDVNEDYEAESDDEPV